MFFAPEKAMWRTCLPKIRENPDLKMVYAATFLLEETSLVLSECLYGVRAFQKCRQAFSEIDTLVNRRKTPLHLNRRSHQS